MNIYGMELKDVIETIEEMADTKCGCDTEEEHDCSHCKYCQARTYLNDLIYDAKRFLMRTNE